MLNIDRLKLNEDAVISVELFEHGLVRGYVTENFQIGGSAEFNEPLKSGAQDTLSEGYNKITSTLNLLPGVSISNRQLTNINQTRLSWTGSSRPSFNINMLLVTIRDEDDILDGLKLLFDAVYPTGTGILKAPLGFNGTGKKGTATITIGRLFEAPGMVIKSVTAEISKEKLESGKPLYINLALAFEPWILPTADRIKSWFRL